MEHISYGRVKPLLYDEIFFANFMCQIIFHLEFLSKISNLQYSQIFDTFVKANIVKSSSGANYFMQFLLCEVKMNDSKSTFNVCSCERLLDELQEPNHGNLIKSEYIFFPSKCATFV